MSLNDNFGIPKKGGIPRSYIFYQGGVGTTSFGTTNNNIPYMTAPAFSQNIGQDFTVTVSVPLGNSFQIINEGLYMVSWMDYNGASQRDIGITVNENTASTGSTTIGSVTTAQGLKAYRRAPAATSAHGCIPVYLYPGDVLRLHNDANVLSAIFEFTLARVA